MKLRSKCNYAEEKEKKKREKEGGKDKIRLVDRIIIIILLPLGVLFVVLLLLFRGGADGRTQHDKQVCQRTERGMGRDETPINCDSLENETRKSYFFRETHLPPPSLPPPRMAGRRRVTLCGIDG